MKKEDEVGVKQVMVSTYRGRGKGKRGGGKDGI